MESGTKPSKAAKRYVAPRNTISGKMRHVRVRQNLNLEKVLFDWFKRMGINNLLISGTILKEKVITYAQ